MRALISLISILLCLLGCKPATPAANSALPPPPEVSVANPMRADVTDYAEYNGHTAARRTVEIRSRVSGYLTEIAFKPGQRVAKGQLLFRIDPKPYAARLQEAEAELSSRKTALELQEVTLKRNEEALTEKAVSEIVVIEARARRDQAKAAIAAANAMVESARIDLQYTELRAPIAGRMGRNMVDEGNLIQGGEQAMLATLVADDPIYVYFNLSDRDLVRYQEVLTAKDLSSIEVEMGLGEDMMHYPFKGKLDFVDTRADAATGTLEARAIFDNPGYAIAPGLVAHVRLAMGALPDTLMVPESALGIDQSGRYLLVVDAQHVVQHMPVKIGPMVDGYRVILSGLDPNASVIVNGLQRARPGSPVTPKPAGEKELAPMAM